MIKIHVKHVKNTIKSVFSDKIKKSEKRVFGKCEKARKARFPESEKQVGLF